MEVYWEYKNKPITDKNGVSEQCVLLTKHSGLSVGYWSVNVNQWQVETLLCRDEVVVAYLEGLQKGK